MKQLILLIIALAFMACNAWATDQVAKEGYYKAGDLTNCSDSSGWSSGDLEDAATATAPGDNFYICSGTYSGAEIDADGNLGINAAVHIIGSGSDTIISSTVDCLSIFVSNVSIRNLVCNTSGVGKAGVKVHAISGAISGIDINDYISTTSTYGIYLLPLNNNGISDVDINRSSISNADEFGILLVVGDATGGETGPLSDISITNSEVFSGTESGIRLQTNDVTEFASAISIQNSKIYNNAWAGLDLENLDNTGGSNLVSGCFIYGNASGQANYGGIKLIDSSHVVMKVNIIANNNRGLYLDDATTADNSLLNCSLYGNNIGVYIASDVDAAGLTCQNNIIDYGAGVGIDCDDQDGVFTSDYCCWNGSGTKFEAPGDGGDEPTHIDNNPVSANPRFMHAGGTDPDDYALRHTSPCINAGTTIAGVATDYFGRTRLIGSAVDIGAIESRYHRRRWRWR